MELKMIRGKLRKVVCASGDVFEGETVVLAAGYESREIAGTVGIDIPMQKAMLEALVTEAEPHMFDQMLGTAEADFYGHQTKHGSFVFGGSSGLEGYTKDNGTPICYSKTALPRYHEVFPGSCECQDRKDMGWLDGSLCRWCSGAWKCGGSAGAGARLWIFRTWFWYRAGSRGSAGGTDHNRENDRGFK